MSSEFLTVIIVVIFAGWAYFRSRKEPSVERQEAPTVPPPVPDTWFTQPEATSKKPAESPEQLEINRAIQARKALQEERRVAEAQDEKASNQAKEKIALADKMVRDSGLAEDLDFLWDLVRCWGSWSVLPQGWDPPEGFLNIHGFDGQAESEVGWEWEDNLYQVRYVKRANYSPDPDWNPRDIHLLVDGEEVAALTYNEQYNDYGESRRYVNVVALTVGPWITDVVRMSEFLRSDQQRNRKRLFAQLDEDKAARIKL